MYGLMMISGCFWSNQVKGSYWGWDPVEVWSLVSWLTYGIYLHLRVTFGWRGRKLAWYALIALFAMIVSYWGIPFSWKHSTAVSGSIITEVHSQYSFGRIHDLEDCYIRIHGNYCAKSCCLL